MQVDTKTPAKSNDTNQNSLFRSLKTFRRKLDKFANNYTPSDGLDELAVALISFLPKVVQPAVTVGALTVLSPFVWKGAKAMAADHQETLNNINSLGKEKASLKNEIIKS